MDQYESEIEAIDAGLTALHRATFQHKAWQDLQRRADVELDRASASLLKAIMHHGNGSCRLHDIARQLGIEAPSVTRKVQELETKGLLSRIPDPVDKRAANIKLTDKGRDQINRLQAARRERLRLLLRTWPATDRTALAALLKQLANDLTEQH